MNHILATIGDGIKAHRVSPSSENLAKIERGGWVDLGALGCSAFGRVKIAPDYAKLCEKCCRGDKRSAGEWREANAPMARQEQGGLL